MSDQADGPQEPLTGAAEPTKPLTDREIRDAEIAAAHQPLDTGRDVARFLGLNPRALTRLLFEASDTARYQSFEIPKRTGGMRRIDAPVGMLRRAQDALLPYLVAMHRAHPAAHGFIAARSIVSNAEAHVGQRLVLNIDLADFFPTVNFGRIRGLFMAAPFSMGPGAATVCARICTHRNGLPQGAPTSPVLSNFIASELDRRLSRLARTNGMRYSRYADDITFSIARDRFPATIAVPGGEGPNAPIAVGEALATAISVSGFEVNPKKVRLQTRHVRQSVTGLTVNDKVNVTRNRVRRIRAMLHAWRKFGLEDAGRDHLMRYAGGAAPSRRSDPRRAFRDALYGELAFLAMVRGEEDPIFRKFCGQLAELDPSPPRMLRRVVFGSADFEVFISHASEDKAEIARPIFEALDRLGVRAFLDQDDIDWGDNFTQKINVALGAARWVLAIVSSHSVSKPWPVQEINTALALDVVGEKRVAPLMVGRPDLSALPLLKGRDAMVWGGDAEAVARRLKAMMRPEEGGEESGENGDDARPAAPSKAPPAPADGASVSGESSSLPRSFWERLLPKGRR